MNIGNMLGGSFSFSASLSIGGNSLMPGLPGMGGEMGGIGGMLPGIGGMLPGIGGMLPGIGGMLPGIGDMSTFSPEAMNPGAAMGNVSSMLGSMLGGNSSVSAMGSLGLGMVPGFGDLSSIMGGGSSSLGIGANLGQTLGGTKQITNMLMGLTGMMMDTTNQQFTGDLQELFKSLSSNGYNSGWGNVDPSSSLLSSLSLM